MVKNTHKERRNVERTVKGKSVEGSSGFEFGAGIPVSVGLNNTRPETMTKVESVLN